MTTYPIYLVSGTAGNNEVYRAFLSESQAEAYIQNKKEAYGEVDLIIETKMQEIG